ncbi:hypothetical protein AVEN_57971-1 [Araneus ventricosus]|uniref:Uncharacterized protein n=1 Tax=Araneus ventricosus TaxID=182803 RepID=A0A4Y2M9M2_ARAVE|nr:hypothetical protein AVEN_57971-1 [Araneus ventricosus]
MIEATQQHLLDCVVLVYDDLFKRPDFVLEVMKANDLMDLICFENHRKSLPSNASLMVGKRVLQGEAWSDLSDSYGTHDLGDKLGDLARNLATLATNR